MKNHRPNKKNKIENALGIDRQHNFQKYYETEDAKMIFEAITGPDSRDHFIDINRAETGILLDHLNRKPPAERTPLDALEAVIFSGYLRVPALAWAIEILDEVKSSAIKDKKNSLDVAFGFKAKGRGKTSLVEKKLRDELEEKLFIDVWKLNLLGYSIDAACRLVADKLKREKGWNKTDYDLDSTRDGKSSSGFIRRFYKWKRGMGNNYGRDYIGPWVTKHGDEFIAKFRIEAAIEEE